MSGRTNPRNFTFQVDGVYSGTLQNVGHTLTQVRLENSAAGGGTQADNYFNGWAYLTLTSGPAAGQSRRIIGFSNATKDATLELPLPAIPGADTYAIVMRLSGDPFIGTAAAGTALTLDLQVKEGIRTGFFAGLPIYLIGGASGAGVNSPRSKGRGAVKYDGPTRRVTVDRAFDAPAPDATTIYRIPGHLYAPLAYLELYEEGGGTLMWSSIEGGMAFGNADHGSKFESGPQRATMPMIEVAMETAGSTGTLHVRRWEVEHAIC